MIRCGDNIANQSTEKQNFVLLEQRNHNNYKKTKKWEDFMNNSWWIGLIFVVEKEGEKTVWLRNGKWEKKTKKWNHYFCKK